MQLGRLLGTWNRLEETRKPDRSVVRPWVPFPYFAVLKLKILFRPVHPLELETPRQLCWRVVFTHVLTFLDTILRPDPSCCFFLFVASLCILSPQLCYSMRSFVLVFFYLQIPIKVGFSLQHGGPLALLRHGDEGRHSPGYFRWVWKPAGLSFLLSSLWLGSRAFSNLPSS